MDRTRALDRRHRRVLVAGIALSVGVHAAAFAGLRFSTPDLETVTRGSVALLPPEIESAVWREAPRVVETVPPEFALLPLDFEAAGDAGAGGAPPPPRAAPPLGGLDAPVVTGGDYAFQRLDVLDPFTNGRVSPVSFGDLPEAEFTVAGEAEDSVAVYVPGSVGQAKRNWAKGSGAGFGDSGAGKGIRIGLVGGGGGHCPMPGKGGRPLPPVWKLGFVARP
jgi:hypothetical protein